VQASLQDPTSERIVMGNDDLPYALATAEEIQRFKEHVRQNGFGGKRPTPRPRAVVRPQQTPAAPKSARRTKRPKARLAVEVATELPTLRSDARPVIIIGGEDHQQKLDRIIKRTRIAVEWCGCEEGERIARRVRDHHIAGLVVLDGLGGHSKLATLMKATRESDIPLEYANKGGIESIILALRKIDARLFVLRSRPIRT